MSTEGKAACVLVAAGRGERLGEGGPKAFVRVGGRPLIWHALRAIAGADLVSHLVAVVPAGYERQADELVDDAVAGRLSGTSRVVSGGENRQRSVALGLSAVPADADIVLVHDAARCLAPSGLLDAVVRAVAHGQDAVVPGLPVVDTLKRIDERSRVIDTPPRSDLRAVQTPQGFRRAVLTRAHSDAEARGDTDAPDDASLVERTGLPVHLVAGHQEAFKITTGHDLAVAETVLARARASAAPAP
ncbi:2-C-methyl-D-erythritol 4-phosphate cytidylyltransferase [Haloactinopolyspora alba]|uniref:2-C-methyl-D-erythritol 4-phosphate cytidylyltransferase n=1 Tax=Haloactinopolyspora alba TaxID=648780 RepID=A0A2P8DZ40_9ACTN|nr:2-C-methyl-D-erythritol 4-phosphate cytidylyltransferase [Haloactinopolyspora alba]PSL02482.1 2-C-methyl-D-erythritol 4-phosphate cytidylyltransferase [Haloactinopolyspora alba]